MNNKESEYFKSRIAAIIISLKDIKDITEEIGSFIESELEEEFNENIDCAIMALSDCLENLHSDEVMEEMDERKNKDIED
jgi:signal recognition particle GTPase